MIINKGLNNQTCTLIQILTMSILTMSIPITINMIAVKKVTMMIVVIIAMKTAIIIAMKTIMIAMAISIRKIKQKWIIIKFMIGVTNQMKTIINILFPMLRSKKLRITVSSYVTLDSNQMISALNSISNVTTKTKNTEAIRVRSLQIVKNR